MPTAPHEWFDSFGDLATWFGSAGTVAAFAVAFLQIHRERKHRKRRELSDGLHLRRSHADRVTAWITDSELIVANHCGHPIHDVVATIATARLTGASPEPSDLEPVSIEFALPGERRFDVPHPPEVTLLPALTFTDARGDRWHREPGHPPVLVGTPNRTAGSPKDQLSDGAPARERRRRRRAGG